MARQDADPADGGRPDLGAARDRQPPRLGARAADPPLALDGADQPVDLEQLAVDLEHLVGVVVAEGDRDGLEEGPQDLGIGGRLPELDGVVVHGGIVPRS